jgi:hypothetical protein
MKKQDKFLTLSIRFNEEDREIVRKLKEDYGFNISGIIKIFLRDKLRQMKIGTGNEK